MGLFRSCRPLIHILAGLNVCIQVMTPTQSSSHMTFFMSSTQIFEVSTVGRSSIRIVSESFSFRKSTIFLQSAATCFRHSSPYRSWLPGMKYSFSIFASLRVPQLIYVPIYHPAA